MGMYEYKLIHTFRKNYKNYHLNICYYILRKGDLQMGTQAIYSIEKVIDFIENHLNGKLDLETVANAVHYSKYHLHRMFTDIVGMTIHDYVIRRQLTEAAKLLVFSSKSIIDIALICGYESQQAFTVAFKAMYKLPPAEYRELQEFYPLQLAFTLQTSVNNMELKKTDIYFAEKQDIDAWMELVHLAIDGYPHLDETDYIQKLNTCIEQRQALIMKNGNVAIGIMAFSYDTGSIDFFGIHPQYRKSGIAKMFLDKLMEDILPEKEISVTTFRDGDRADTGYREALKKLGFAERELLVEFGYPTQRFVLSPRSQEVYNNEQ